MIKKIRNQLSTPFGHFLLNKRVDDIYIAAYPRSGSTWLRTILVNVLDPSAKSDPDRFNAIIPAVSIRNASVINRLQSPRLIMTHSCWRPSINKAVYLIRDGRDAFISSYHYHTTRNQIPMSLDDYFIRYESGVYGQRWGGSVGSWLNEGEKALKNNLLIIKFEDMKKYPLKTIIQVCAFIGIPSSKKLLESAISDASLLRVQEIEKQRQGEISNGDASFYRTGESEQWKQEKYMEVINKFQIDAKQALQNADYII